MGSNSLCGNQKELLPSLADDDMLTQKKQIKTSVCWAISNENKGTYHGMSCSSTSNHSERKGSRSLFIQAAMELS